MTQLHNQVNEVTATADQIFAELEKQRTENDTRNQEQLDQVLKERQKWDEDKATVDKFIASASTIVNLNAGGEKMSILRTTLTADKGSLLATLFSGNWDETLPKDKDGYIFLDYDPAVSRNFTYS